MADMVPEPSLRHLPVMTGAAGRGGLARFVSFDRGLIASQRVLWDLATLGAQLGLRSPAAALAGDPDS
jgi:hypothetical protein